MANFDEDHCRRFEESDTQKKQQRVSAQNGASEAHDQPAPTGKNGEQLTSRTKPPTQAENLITLARAGVEHLFHHQERAYADIQVDGHRETWPVKSKRFRQWLKRLYYAEHNKAPNAEAVQEALEHVEAAALFEGEERQVYLRVAGRDGRIYIDLGSPDWRAIEIDDDGWRVIDDPPVRFRRPAGMKALPEPTRGGEISTLRKLANVKDESDFVLVVSWLLAAMHARGPYPVLAISGEQGTAKSTLVAILRALVDPNVSPLRAPPREDRELFIQANNAWLLTFDNVSGLPPWLSDSLCRLSTGGGFAVRQLHTDQEEILFDACRPIVLNGIGDMVGRADLADRAIFITLEPIPENIRRAEDELWAHIERELPGILGVLCCAISHGLRYREVVTLDRLPRMADFAKLGVACEGAFWPAGTFMAAYDDNQRGANDAVIDADDVAVAVRAFMQTQQAEWEGAPTEFHRALENDRFNEDKHRPKGWPTTASELSSRLRRAAPSLRRMGITIEWSRSGKGRKRKIRLASRAPSAEHEYSENSRNLPSAPSASPGEREKQSPTNDFTADSELSKEPSASRPPSSPAVDEAGHDADTEPKAPVRRKPLEDNQAAAADGADSDSGLVSDCMEKDDGLDMPVSSLRQRILARERRLASVPGRSAPSATSSSSGYAMTARKPASEQ